MEAPALGLSRTEFKTDFGKQKIRIIAVKVNGLGDLSCGYRLAENLVKRTNLLKENIVISTNSPEDMKLFNTLGFEVTDRSTIRMIEGVALQLICPAFKNYNHNPELMTGIPTLQLFEYGFENRVPADFFGTTVVSKSMGLKVEAQEVGVWIDPDLVEWGFSEKAQNPVERVKKLEGLSDGLRQAIVGLEFKAEKFVKENKLYFGYANNFDHAYTFMNAILTLNSAEKEHLVIVFPGQSTLIIEGEESIKSKLLRDQNIGTLVMKYFYEGAIIQENKIQLSEKSSKVLTLILGQITNPDMRLLWMASEREVVATGDQSLSEAISANKSIVYEALTHKNKLGEMLRNRYRQCISILWNYDSFRNSQKLVTTYGHNLHDSYREVTEINKDIVNHCDTLPRIVKLVDEIMGMERKQATPFIDWRGFRIYVDIPPKSIPFDMFICLTYEQVIELKIKHDNTSDVPDLNDSTFICGDYEKDLFIIRRRKP